MDGVDCPQRRAHDNTITAAVRPELRRGTQEHQGETRKITVATRPDARRGAPGDPPAASFRTNRPALAGPAQSASSRPGPHRPHRPAPSTSTRTDRLDPHRPPRPARPAPTTPTRTDPHRPALTTPTRPAPTDPTRPENKKRRLRNLKRLRSLVGAEGFEPPTLCL